MEKCGLDSFGKALKPVAVFCKYDNELSGFIKGE
jgi:hypothetical protein